MERIITRLDVYAENGKDTHGHHLSLEMDGSLPDCPISFIADGKPVFSMGCYEVEAFVAALQKLVP